MYLGRGQKLVGLVCICYTELVYAVKLPITVEEYLEGEEKSFVRHEYLAGQIYAMAGASKRHNQIVMNLVAALHGAARAKGCHIYASDMKLRVADDSFYYPDLMLVCNSSDNDYYETQACVLVEVLSPSTAEIDRREKLHAYQQLSDLKAYILIDSQKKDVLVYHKYLQTHWQERVYFQANGRIEIPCVDILIDIDTVYAGVDF